MTLFPLAWRSQQPLRAINFWVSSLLGPLHQALLALPRGTVPARGIPDAGEKGWTGASRLREPPRRGWTTATRHCQFHPAQAVASGKQSRCTREKRPRYQGFSRVRSVSSPWGIGVDCAQDCPRLIQRVKGYISGVSIINSMETRKDR